MRVFGWLLGELPRSVVGLHRVEAVLGEDDRVTYGETVPDTTGGPDSGTVLAQLFDGLSGDPAGAIVVEGHTSTEGSDSHNIDLSERRAQAVVDDLVSPGDRCVPDHGSRQGRI